MADANTDSSGWGKVALYVVPTAALYAALFVFERDVIEMSRQGHWYFIVPIAIAFAVSYFHGGLTASFWDALGVKAKH